MQKSHSLQSPYLNKAILVLAGFIGFNYSATATEQITNDQILRVAKIARDTGTNITIIKETTTVKVYGSNKKTNKKVKRSVLKFMKQKTPRLKVSAPEASNFEPPELREATVRPPVLDQSAGVSRAPALDNDFY